MNDNLMTINDPDSQRKYKQIFGKSWLFTGQILKYILQTLLLFL